MVVYNHGHADALFREFFLFTKGAFGMDNHDISEEAEEMYFWIGIGVMLLGNTLSALGLMGQKYAHQREEEDENVSRVWYFTSPTWLCGFLVFILGHILIWVSLALGPQAVLSCLTCWSTVVTVVVAPIFLNETVTLFRLLSVFIMIFGCSWVILSWPRSYQPFTVDTLLSAITNTLFLVLTALALMYLLVLGIIAARSNKTPRLTALQYTTVAAILGWYSVLTAKITSGLVFSSWHHALNQFDRWESWVMVATMIVLAVANLHFLNMALSVGDAVYVVPVNEALSILGQCLLGGIFFSEFQRLSIYGHINFWLGISSIIAGIFCLARKGPETKLMQYPILSPTSGRSTVSAFSPEHTPPVSP